MEKSSKRGKIPQQDWPSIIERYESGETLASIARTYDCSPPAISYIVSRSRARNAGPEAAAPSPSSAFETHLVKIRPTEPLSDSPQNETAFGLAPGDLPAPAPSPPASQEAISADEPIVQAPSAAQPAPLRQSSPQLPAFLRDPPRPAGNGMAERQGPARREPVLPGNGSAGRPFAPAGGGPAATSEARARLHLPRLPGNEVPSDHEPPARAPQPPQGIGFAHPEDRFDRRMGSPPPPPSRPVFPSPASSPQPGEYPRSAHGQLPETERTGEGGEFIGRSLRERVAGDIAAFLAAFDAALDHDTLESRAGLREATDRLLRAGARTRIELERLEARVPLSPRDRSGQPAAVRYR